MEVTPQYILDINTRLEGLMTSNWQRVAMNAGSWARVMKKRPSSSKVELLTWILDTAGLYPQGNGGNFRFDDMVALSTQLENFDVGGALRLTTNELADNQLKDNPKVGTMDFAQKWARDRGGEIAYWPRSVLLGANGLIQQGGTALCYDGNPFFYASHPVDPSRTGGGTYSNIITGVDISTSTGAITDVVVAAEALARAIAAIQVLTFTSAKIPRMLVPKVIVHPTALTFRVRQLLGIGGTNGADILTQTTNMLGTYGFDAPIAAPELDAANASTYYIGCEDILSDELGAFVYSERKAYEMRGYPDVDSARQNRSKVWEWTVDGRNGSMYGHPYLFFKCTA